MAKQIDHDKLNEFFGLASEFGDVVERYREHEQLLLDDSTDSTRKKEIRQEMAKERRQLQKLFPSVKEELPTVISFHTSDGGTIDDAAAKVTYVEENIFKNAA